MSQTKQPRKNTPAKPSLERARIATQILQEELDSGLDVLSRMQKQKKYLAEQVVEEFEAQKVLRAKIERVKKEIKLLKMSQTANQKIYDKARSERLTIERDLKEVEEQLATVRSTSSRTIKNDFARLIEAVNLTGKDYQNHKSVVLTCARDLIKTTEQNEFDDFEWRAKIAMNQARFGMRLRFDRLTISPRDLNEVYLPTIRQMAQKFAVYNLSLKTKMKKENGIVTALDVTVTIPLKTTVQTQKRPEA